MQAKAHQGFLEPVDKFHRSKSVGVRVDVYTWIAREQIVPDARQRSRASVLPRRRPQVDVPYRKDQSHS